ncbi:MAG: hypothetical protein ING69_13745 [Rhodocyclaceae bacterium]|jgi:hypothetical protein|nr:hypothetical protein [Rhodocyclaceae bacterium]MCA3083707.1 hypothetical protein [Rhodocyclaceae bacterium]
MKALHTSNPRHYKRCWIAIGGTIEPVHCTGEVRYFHPLMIGCIRANDRRHDVPAVLLSRYNQIVRIMARRMEAANDENYDPKTPSSAKWNAVERRAA